MISLVASALFAALLSFGGLRFLPLFLQQKGWTLSGKETEKRFPAAGVLYPASAVFAFYLSLIVAGIAGELNSDYSVLSAGIVCSVGLAMIGFWEDSMDFLRRSGEQVPVLQRFIPEGILLMALLGVAGFSGHLSTLLDIPFGGMIQLSFGYYPLILVLALGVLELYRWFEKKTGAAIASGSGVLVGFFVGSLFLNLRAPSLFSLASVIGIAFYLFGKEKGFLAGGMGEVYFLAGSMIVLSLQLDFPLLLIWASLGAMLEGISRLILKKTSICDQIHHKISAQAVWVLCLLFSVFCGLILALCCRTVA